MKWWCLFILAIVLSSCEKTIHLQPESQPPLLVVDGIIELGQSPLIYLSTSLNYFSEISPSILESSLVRDAVVTLSNGSKTVPLKMYSRLLGGGYELVYYSVDSSLPANMMVGQEGRAYTLVVRWQGKSYQAITEIPAYNKTCDSIWWKQAPHNDDTTKVVLMGRFTDPKGFGDYIRYFTKVNSERFLPGANSAFDDQVTDGTTYDFQVDQGVDRNNMPDQDDYGYFHRGDTISLKFCNIGKATFDFWRTLEFAYQSTNNPFSSPTKVLGNVSNGALGAFCGYSYRIKTIIVHQ